jgi:hypothetical protein
MKVDVLHHHLVNPLLLCCCCPLGQAVLPAVAPKVHCLPELRVLGEQTVRPGPHQRVKNDPAHNNRQQPTCAPGPWQLHQPTGHCSSKPYGSLPVVSCRPIDGVCTYPVPFVAPGSLLEVVAAAAAPASPPSCQASCSSSTLCPEGFRGWVL